MGEASAGASIRYCQLHNLFSDHNLALRCCRWRVLPQARKILGNKLLWPKERSATVHIVLLSTYYALHGIGVFLLVVGNGGGRQYRPKMPKMEIDLTLPLNAPVLQDVKYLMIQ